MTAFAVTPISDVYRHNVTGTGDVFAYLGIDGKLYYRVGDTGAYSVLATLTITNNLSTSYSGAQKCLYKVTITTTGLLLVTYMVWGVNNGDWGNEYALVNISGTIVSSGVLQPPDADLDFTWAAGIPVVKYDYTNTKFHMLRVVRNSVMGQSKQELQYSTISSTGTLVDGDILESNAIASPRGYDSGFFSSDFTIVDVRDNGTYAAAYNISTLAAVATIPTSVIVTTDTLYYRDEGNTGDAIYVMQANHTSIDLYVITEGASFGYTNVASISLTDAKYVNCAGIRLSSDGNTLYCYTLNETTTTGVHQTYTHTVDVNLGVTVARNFTYVGVNPFSIAESEFGYVKLYYATGITGLLDSGVSTNTVVVWMEAESSFTESYEGSFTPVTNTYLDIDLNLTLAGIVPQMELFAYTPQRDVELDLILPSIIPYAEINIAQYISANLIQLTHSVEKFLYSSQGTFYTLVHSVDSLIPMLNFTLTKNVELDGTFSTSVRASIPLDFQEIALTLVGSTIAVFKNFGDFSQLLSESVVHSVSIDSDRAIIFAKKEPVTFLGQKNNVVEKLLYFGSRGGKRVLRFKPDTNIAVNDLVTYNSYNNLLISRATTFISLKYSFTEVQE